MNSNNTDFKYVLLSALKGLAAAITSALLLSLILTAVLCTTQDPLEYLPVASIAALIVSFISGGVFSAVTSTSPILSSVTYAAMHLVLILIVGIIFPQSEISFEFTIKVIIYSAALASAIISSLIISKKRSSAKRPRSRAKRYR